MSDTYTLGRWFAWRPVRLMSGGWAWLRYVRLVYAPDGLPSNRLRKAVGSFVAYADAVTSFGGPDECNDVADGLYDTAVAFARAALNTQHKGDDA